MRLLINGRPTVLTQSIPRIVLRPDDVTRALAATRNPRPSASGEQAEGVPEMECFDVEAQDGHGVQPSRGIELLVEMQGNEGGEDGNKSDEEAFWTGSGQKYADDDEDIQDWGHVDDEVEWDARDKDDIRAQVDDFMNDTGNINESEPVDEAERGKQPVDKATYSFCPLPHRLTILRLFAKHASQHSLLPERHGVPRNAEEIWRDAVEVVM